MTFELSADNTKLERRCKAGQAFRRIKNNKLHPIHEELEFNFVLAARRKNYLGSVGPVTSPLPTGRAASEEIRGTEGEVYHIQDEAEQLQSMLQASDTRVCGPPSKEK